MSKGKHARLMDELGKHMNESAGNLGIEDRFVGFIPSSTSHGEMPLDRILEDPDQPRKSFDEQALKDLAANLKSHGVQQPIQLRWSDANNKWLIVYGHRRFRAAKLAGFVSIPCTFADEGMDESTLRVRQLVENCQRENLAPIEMARGLESLASLTGWSNRRISEELGLSKVTIGRYLGLLELPEDVQDLVEKRELAPSVANEISKVDGAQDQARLAREIAHEKLSRSDAKERISRATGQKQTNAPVSMPRPEKQLLVNTAHLSIYRCPLANDLKIKQELLSIVEQLDTEKAEN